jgi:hypothetical protein
VLWLGAKQERECRLIAEKRLREIADKRAELDLISAQKITNDSDEVQRTLRGKIKELQLELEGLNRDASRIVGADKALPSGS